MRIGTQRRRQLAPAGTSVMLGLIFALTLLSAPHSALAQNVTVRVTILGVRALTNFDGADEADWFATVTIDGSEMDNEDTPETEDVEGNDEINVNWVFSKDVAFSAGNASVNIEIRDEDGFLKLDDDLADVNPAGGQSSLDLNIGFSPCTITGDAAGTCKHPIVSFSNGPEDGDGRAEVRFKVEVLNVPGLQVRCTHSPLWPQPGDSVTLRVDALDGNLNSKVADTLRLSRENVPDDEASSQGSHSLTFTPTGDSFVYGCGADAGTEAVFSGWRRVMIGDPPAGERAVPVVFNTDSGTGIDILLVPDQDNYTGAKDPLFLAHAAEVIFDPTFGVYGERVFLERQHQLNIYLATDTGDAEGFDSSIPACPHVPPANFDTDYLFAEAAAIIHTDDFRDCAKGGERVFSAEPPSLVADVSPVIEQRVFVHELGHRPFGLADEYCNKRPGSQNGSCDGGYYQQSTFPNIFADAAMCAADASSEGFGTLTCDEFVDDRGGGPWSTYDPVVNDLMSDNGDARFLDRRRIHGVLDNCPMGGC